MTDKPRPADWALSYAEAGLHILPCRADDGTPDTGKQAWVKEWQHRATTDQTTIRTWWEMNPDSNIGWVPGLSGYVVIDLDRKPGLDYFNERFRKWDPETQPPPTRCHLTPNGIHLIYKVPEGETIGSGVIWRNPNPDKLPELKGGIDYRSEGGYVLLPGSVVGGKPYQVHPDSPTIRILPEEWLPLFQPSSVSDDTDDLEWDEPHKPSQSGCNYCQVALDNILAEISGLQEGERNEGLTARAKRFWELPDLDHENDTSLLISAAVTAGLPEREAEYCVRKQREYTVRKYGHIGLLSACDYEASVPKVTVAVPSPDTGDWIAGGEVKREATQMLIDGLVLRKKPALWYGEGGSGKSTLASYVAIRHCQPRGLVTLVLVNEEDPPDIRARWEMHQADPNSVLMWVGSKPLNSGEALAAVYGKAVEKARSLGYRGVGAVIIDPVTEFLGGAKLKDMEAVRPALLPWKQLTAQEDLLTICLSHTNKDENVSAAGALFGSTAFKDSFRAVSYLGHDPEAEDDRMARAIVVTKSNKLPKGVGWRFRLGLDYLGEVADQDGWSKVIQEVFVEDVVATGVSLDAQKMRLLQFGRGEGKTGWSAEKVAQAIKGEIWEKGFAVKAELEEVLLGRGVTGYMWKQAKTAVNKEPWVVSVKPGLGHPLGVWVDRDIQGSDLSDCSVALGVDSTTIQSWLK